MVWVGDDDFIRAWRRMTFGYNSLYLGLPFLLCGAICNAHEVSVQAEWTPKYQCRRNGPLSISAGGMDPSVSVQAEWTPKYQCRRNGQLSISAGGMDP